MSVVTDASKSQSPDWNLKNEKLKNRFQKIIFIQKQSTAFVPSAFLKKQFTAIRMSGGNF